MTEARAAKKRTVKKIARKLRNILRKRKQVDAAYLYGSVAKYGHGNDIDVGIVAKGSRGMLYAVKLALEIEKETGLRNIDMRVMNRSSPVLIHQVLKHGILLFSRDEKRRVQFEKAAMLKYLDMKRFNDYYNKKRAERMLA